MLTLTHIYVFVYINDLIISIVIASNVIIMRFVREPCKSISIWDYKMIKQNFIISRMTCNFAFIRICWWLLFIMISRVERKSLWNTYKIHACIPYRSQSKRDVVVLNLQVLFHYPLFPTQFVMQIKTNSHRNIFSFFFFFLRRKITTFDC